MTPEEEQKKLFLEFLKTNNIPFIETRNEVSMYQAKRKRHGRNQEGIPDLILLFNKGESIFIELKAEKKAETKIYEKQQEWIDKLNNLGHKAHICYGFLQAKQVVEKYLGYINEK